MPRAPFCVSPGAKIDGISLCNQTCVSSLGGSQSMSAVSIANELRGQKSGSGWVAKCPAHDDRNPSLSLREADGKILVHCHAGCDPRAVVAALRSRGLWPEKERRERGKIVGSYDYTDENGNLLYQIVRL